MRRLARRAGRVLWALAALVVTWRIAAFLTGPRGSAELARGLLGVAFVAGGLVGFRIAGDAAGALFALYATSAGLHWGGPVGPPSLEGNPVFTAPYLIVSAAAPAALLAFAVAFDGRREPSARWLWFLLPAGVVAMALPVALAAPPPLGAVGRTAVAAGYAGSSLLALAATVVLATRTFGPERQPGAGWALAGLLLGGAAPALLGVALGEGTASYAEPMHVLIPLLAPAGLATRSRDA